MLLSVGKDTEWAALVLAPRLSDGHRSGVTVDRHLSHRAPLLPDSRVTKSTAGSQRRILGRLRGSSGYQLELVPGCCAGATSSHRAAGCRSTLGQRRQVDRGHYDSRIPPLTTSASTTAEHLTAASAQGGPALSATREN
jgi:hypothetical protein